jgi:DNA-directed RNA polymerase specialized sigma subunit
VNLFANVITDVFERHAENRLDIDEERAAIERAKLGDTDATVALVYAYAPALRSSVSNFRKGAVARGERPNPAALADLRMSAIEGLIEAVHAFDPDRYDRLAATVSKYVANSVATYLVSPIAITIPQRTLTRFYGILRTAEGNAAEGARIAPEYEMTTETFLAVLSAVREADSFDALAADEGDDRGFVNVSPVWDGAQADAEDRILVEAAFAAVDQLEADVVRLAYGFTDYDPVPDAEVAERLGLSRQKAQRTRNSALSHMRDALGVA